MITKEIRPIIKEINDKITRIEVIDEEGRAYSHWNCSVEFSYQDDGKTLKIFVKPHKK